MGEGCRQAEPGGAPHPTGGQWTRQGAHQVQFGKQSDCYATAFRGRYSETLARVADVEGVKSRRLPAGRHVESGEVRQLFVACGSDPAGARDAAMLALLYGGGLRRSEAVALQLADYDVTAATLTVRHGKGDAARQVYGMSTPRR